MDTIFENQPDHAPFLYSLIENNNFWKLFFLINVSPSIFLIHALTYRQPYLQSSDFNHYVIKCGLLRNKVLSTSS